MIRGATTTLVETMASRWLIASGLLLWAIVLAAEDARLEISPTYGEILSDEIYERAEDWREPPMFESEWRATQPQKQGRIKFGYDSAYEELRARESVRSSSRPLDLRDPKPNTLFRFSF